jgi:hypothetical protein
MPFSRPTLTSLKQTFARANKTNWSWLLPGIALGITHYYTGNYELWFASDSLNLKFLCFNLLVPALALWLLSARQTEPRVLMWASIPTMIFPMPAIPVFASYIYVFNSDRKVVRIAAQILLAFIAIIATAAFAVVLFFFKPAIYDHISQTKILERVQVGEYKVILLADNNDGAVGDRIEAEKPVGEWLKIVHRLASSRWRDGFYSDLKVVDDHTITVKHHYPDEETPTVETLECAF